MRRLALLVMALVAVAACGGENASEERAEYDAHIRREVNDRLTASMRDLETLADEIDANPDIGYEQAWRDRALDMANRFVRARLQFVGREAPDDRQDHNEALDTTTDCYAHQATTILAMLTVNMAPSPTTTPSADFLRGVREICGPIPAIEPDSP